MFSALLDNNLSPNVSGFLRQAGHNVVHVRDIDLGSATDAIIVDAARAQYRC